MRDTETSDRMVQSSRQAALRLLRLCVVGLGIGLVVMAGAARAEDDEDDDKTFEEKIIEGLMAGIGGTNMENRGIDYRERSPLVVPPKLDLPPRSPSRLKSRIRTGRKIRTWRAARLRSPPGKRKKRTRWKPAAR